MTAVKRTLVRDPETGLLQVIYTDTRTGEKMTHSQAKKAKLITAGNKSTGFGQNFGRNFGGRRGADEPDQGDSQMTKKERKEEEARQKRNDQMEHAGNGQLGQAPSKKEAPENKTTAPTGRSAFGDTLAEQQRKQAAEEAARPQSPQEATDQAPASRVLGATPAAVSGAGSALNAVNSMAHNPSTPAPTGGLAPTTSVADTSTGRGMAYNSFLNMDFNGFHMSPAQAAAMAGQIEAESGFNPAAVGDQGKALGLAQHNSRGPQMVGFVGPDWKEDVKGQYDFMKEELSTTEKATLDAFKANPNMSLEEATKVAVGFERPMGYTPANPENAHNFAGRLAAARAIAEEAANGVYGAPAPEQLTQDPSLTAPAAPMAPAGLTKQVSLTAAPETFNTTQDYSGLAQAPSQFSMAQSLPASHVVSSAVGPNGAVKEGDVGLGFGDHFNPDPKNAAAPVDDGLGAIATGINTQVGGSAAYPGFKDWAVANAEMNTAMDQPDPTSVDSSAPTSTESSYSGGFADPAATGEAPSATTGEAPSTGLSGGLVSSSAPTTSVGIGGFTSAPDTDTDSDGSGTSSGWGGWL